MPETHFRILWSDGAEEEGYSPSSVLWDHLTPGAEYPLADFLARSRSALAAANERVRAKFGLGCSRAAAQLARIEAGAAARMTIEGASVRVNPMEPA